SLLIIFRSPGRRWPHGPKLDLLGVGWWFEYKKVRSQVGLQVPVGERHMKAWQIRCLRVRHNQIPWKRALTGIDPDFPMDSATLEGQVLARRPVYHRGAYNECTGQVFSQNGVGIVKHEVCRREVNAGFVLHDFQQL